MNGSAASGNNPHTANADAKPDAVMNHTSMNVSTTGWGTPRRDIALCQPGYHQSRHRNAQWLGRLANSHRQGPLMWLEQDGHQPAAGCDAAGRSHAVAWATRTGVA
jgi:hypothetical protein